MSLPDMIEWAEEHPDRAAVRIAELERENAALLDLVARMAAEMREIDHEFASLRDYDAGTKEAQP